jgi:uncharacterized membrane protein YgdD (TMEM256/DUF423 family)
MPLQAKFFLVVGAVSALLSVLIGAAATHMSNDHLQGAMHWFNTGMQYQQFHALALIAVGLIFDRRPSRWTAAAGWLMVAGSLIFSGNLYLRSLVGYHALHAVTPFGGGAFMLGWLALVIGVLTPGGSRCGR